MLNFESRWRFHAPGAIISDVIDEVYEKIIARIATNGGRQDVLEALKRRFAQAAGKTSSRSSNVDWAESDLRQYMRDAGENAALFVEALYDGLIDLSRFPYPVVIPEWEYVNQALASSGYVIDPPHLIVGKVSLPISVPVHIPSLDEQANDRIQKSLHQSETFMNEGCYRAAVQEILWLLETVSTVFQGVQYPDGDIAGKYFNKIIGELQRVNRGRPINRVLEWLQNMHGYLSAPAGGGIRHGAVLKENLDISESEARLYCDLTRSYTSFLLSEYALLGR